MCFYFNSTMVRLKVNVIHLPCRIALFQFHYGTIKSTASANGTLEGTTFQFHYGTIKR